MGTCHSQQDPHEQAAENHLDEQHGEELSPGVKKLAAVLKTMNEQVFKTPTKHSMLANVGIIVHQCKAEPRHTVPISNGKNFTDMAVLMKTGRYAKYATAAYKTDHINILKAIQDVEEESDLDPNMEILHAYSAPEGSKCPSFFIVFDKAANDVILSIRGSGVMQDALPDTLGDTVPFLDGLANEVLVAKAKEVVAKAKEPLEQSLNKGPNSLAIVGHCTGGGVASLVTLMGFGGDTAADKMLASGKAKCHAFGPPPVFDPVDKGWPKSAAAVYTYINGMDMIPRTSKASTGRLLMAARKVDDIDMDMEGRLKVIGGKDPAPENVPDDEDIPEEFASELKSLCLVGTIIVLYKDREKKVHCETASVDKINRILLCSDMSKHHLMSHYEDSIEETLVMLQRNKGCC